jgi:hypothetical protein
MATRFDPPHYEWSARTVEQALNELEAAKKILEAYLLTLAPGGGLVERGRLATVTPAVMVLHLNMSHVVNAIKEETEFQEVTMGIELPDTPETLS